MGRSGFSFVFALAMVPACAGPPASTRSAGLVAPGALAHSPPSPGQPIAPEEEMPDPASSAPVSLHALLAHADEHAPSVALGRARRARGAAARDGAAGLFPDDPVLTLGAARRREGGRDGTDLEASLEQRIHVGGQRGLRIAAAERLERQLGAELDEVRWRVHQEVHRAFHAALIARARVASASRVAEFNRRLVEIAQKRVAAGDIPRLHVRLAEGELAIASEQKIAAEQLELGARLTLAEVSGWPVDSPPSPAGELDSPRTAPPAAGLIARALAGHPSLRSLAAAADEAAARRALAGRQAVPDLTLGLSLARESAPRTGESERIAGVTVGIPLPLWQRNRAERAAAGADLREAEARHEAVRSSIAVRVTRAAGAVNAGAARVQAYGSEIIPRFEENLALLSRAFELGEIDVLQALLARERFLQLERDSLAAFADYYEAVAELEAELGQELWPDDRHDHDHGGGR